METGEGTEGKDRTLRTQPSTLSEASARVMQTLDPTTLLDALPVGIVVINALAGTLASVNREARRLAGDLLTPGQSMGHFLQTISVRRGDGRMLSLEEHPVARAASTGETIRAEEVVFQVPNGRRVSALMNARPVLSDDGEVGSLVVTLQDLTPVHDLMRTSGELLAGVSRVLRTPLAAIKGAASTALGDADDGDAGGTAQFFRIIDEQANYINSMIKGIRDAARKGSGALRVDPSPEGVMGLVEQARDAFFGGAGSASVRIDPPPDSTQEVPGKPGPLSGPDDVSRRTARSEPLPILVVDDDTHTLRNVRDVLAREGYHPCVTGNPHDIPGLLEKHRPALVLLDLVLPGTDGVEVMTDVIADPDLPVIFLSAYAHEEAIARALDAGAADYMVKPFAPAELSARIRAALRRREEREYASPEEPFVQGDLRIDYNRREVTIAGRPIHLTRLEYRLMVELSANAGRLVTNEDLLRRVWDTLDSADTRRLRTTIKKLRRKLGDNANNPTYILNHPGEGYRLGESSDQAFQSLHPVN